MKNIIVDLDGTIAIDEHRRPLIKSEGWNAYFNACLGDEPNQCVIDFMRSLQLQYHIHILTGRAEYTRQMTDEWLRLNEVVYHNLLMRQNGHFDPTATSSDEKVFRPDHAVKQDMIDKLQLTPANTLCVLDDTDHMVKFWREKGFDCWQVRPQGVRY